MSLLTSVSLAETVDGLLVDGLPIRFTAYDGSAAGPEDSPYTLHLASERGLAYLLTAPGDLGMARAYVSGDLEVHGDSPGNPYAVMSLLLNHLDFRRPGVVETVNLLRNIGLSNLVPPPPPASEHLPRWRRAVEGLRHSQARDAEVIAHHYDVSNRFYEMVLGPSMTYTCAVHADNDVSLEEAQFAKYELIAQKLALKPGQRLLDVGCGWGGMVRHVAKEHGVKALGVTLSANQAAWGQAKIREEGLEDLAEVRHLDYRDVKEGGFDAVSSIGLTEHIGVANYPAYFGFLRERLRPGGRLLNHCITRPHNRPTSTGQFIDRYVFPDGELTGSGTIVAAVQDAGLEVQHTENLRTHYARTLAGWSQNLADNWDECVAEAGVEIARVWGIYMAGSRIAFERDEIELHHVLATRNHDDGDSEFPRRPDWTP
ncbi:SAM-dependent methyltransferase [Nocardioides alcanivorans]|uniref:SAM-dependent methyltransferase n=1 Tax=Nocardioides alcanivorans TaxID=2897352 RepID=UPI001F1899AD|nr:cyclopropane-fatty-acyl-phospholipid synthase family protein [Nocardioides alcanivorans]